MGEIWSATNQRTQRDVAIKFLLPQLARHEEAVTRFVQEARATGSLRHPNIVDLFDAGQSEGRLYLVMELLDGESLEAMIQRVGRLDPVATCVLLAPIARALAFAHARGVVHRDLSSPNVFLARSPGSSAPQPKILDFGVSKVADLEGPVVTGSGAVLGSPQFMSPEQAQGAEGVDARSDLWAVGVLLYECLSGRLPFRAGNYNALMLAISRVPHRPLAELCPDLPAELCAICEDCLVKDREARIQTAEALAARLEHQAFVLSGGQARVGLRRRATDRLAPPSLDARFTQPPPAARLPDAALPRGVRAWQLLASNASPRRMIATSSALAGTAVGFALGVVIASRGPTLGVTGAALPPLLAPIEARPEHAAVTPDSLPPGAESTDLAEATARSLGVGAKPRRVTQPPRAPSPGPAATTLAAPRVRDAVALRKGE